MIKTREQDQRVQELARHYPHGVGIIDLHEAIHMGQLAHAALITCHDAHARPVYREIMLPDGTRFVEPRFASPIERGYLRCTDCGTAVSGLHTDPAAECETCGAAMEWAVG